MELKSYHQFKELKNINSSLGNKITIDFDGMEFEQESFFHFHKELLIFFNSFELKINLDNLSLYEENSFFDTHKKEHTVSDALEAIGKAVKGEE